MILLCEESRKFLDDLVAELQVHMRDRYPNDPMISEGDYGIQIVIEAQRVVDKYVHDVWGAVELDTGFRLPHELRGHANCGEKAALLYALAVHQGFDKIQFYFRQDSRYNPEITHAFVTM